MYSSALFQLLQSTAPENIAVLHNVHVNVERPKNPQRHDPINTKNHQAHIFTKSHSPDERAKGGRANAQLVAQTVALAHRNPQVKDEDAATPLFHAAFWTHVDVARDLVNAGANVNAQRNDGFTPLHVAVKNNQPRMTDVLVKAMSSLSIQEVINGVSRDLLFVRHRPCTVCFVGATLSNQIQNTANTPCMSGHAAGI